MPSPHAFCASMIITNYSNNDNNMNTATTTTTTNNNNNKHNHHHHHDNDNNNNNNHNTSSNNNSLHVLPRRVEVDDAAVGPQLRLGKRQKGVIVKGGIANLGFSHPEIDLPIYLSDPIRTDSLIPPFAITPLVVFSRGRHLLQAGAPEQLEVRVELRVLEEVGRPCDVHSVLAVQELHLSAPPEARSGFTKTA